MQGYVWIQTLNIHLQLLYVVVCYLRLHHRSQRLLKNSTFCKVPFEVKPTFRKGSKFHCCKQGTLYPSLNIDKELHVLPSKETHAVG